MVWLIGINVVIAASYTLFPKKAPATAAVPGEEGRTLTKR